MADNTYQPAKVWTWDKSDGGAFANINRPVSGPTHDKTLPVGNIRYSFTRWGRLTARK